ncbi:hypothetical protein TNCV_4596101 [Trichonephila clavipes]|uniref:Uncharacterized protein n=1 Tax=Trichonephila clavipes TaxID=2585209 RepID=A0A8X7BKP0_TRICX|nr:hypothetical protein TNCV_4596101 [Trichonephila clavipes]
MVRDVKHHCKIGETGIRISVMRAVEPKSSREVGRRVKEVGEPDYSQGIFPKNWGGSELNRSVTCMVLKATANDRRHLALCHDEFHGHLPIM